jgi:ketosteroid isomerase-like protein
VDKIELIGEAMPEFLETRRAGEAFADDLVWDMSEFAGWVEATHYVGLEAFNEQIARWTAPFSAWTVEYSELTDLGGDDVLALGVQRGTLKDSGAVIDMPLAQILTVRGGKLVRMRLFATHEDARRAAGVSG